jgi:dienelactone hydrolase
MFKKYLQDLWRAVRLPASGEPKSAKFPIGASYGLLLFVIIAFAFSGYHYNRDWSPWLMMAIGAVAGFVAFHLFSLLGWLVVQLFQGVPSYLTARLIGAVGALYLLTEIRFPLPDPFEFPGLYVSLLLMAILLGGIWLLTRAKQLRTSERVLAVVGMVAAMAVFGYGTYWLAKAGENPYPIENWEATSVETLAARGLENPALPGTFAVDSFTYGSGDDVRRKAFNEQVRFVTPTVDAREIIPEWRGKKKKARERYWQFSVDSLPLNGRAYLPQGDGPFPLVLMVHGNHSMTDYSDDGYGYLGRLLASRGFAAVSVDENFINGHWSGDFGGKEMPARAWFLLKHLELWRNWMSDPKHELFGKIDMDELMLIGHSRGGEAVAIAAAFNKLPYYPDNAKVEFDFGFNIKGIVAIAPTDYRYDRQMKLENINYLSLQGSYDSDEVGFFGLRQYRRVAFNDTSYHFKAGVYIHGANHGQFNSTWGMDFGPPGSWFINRAPIIPAAEQREVAKVCISAFAEAVFNDRHAYLLLFQNAARAGDWLPENFYLTNFQNANANILVDYEEDIDITQGKNGVTMETANLKFWREKELRYRNDLTQGNNGVVVGWDYGDSLRLDSLAVYAIELPTAVTADSSDRLLVSVAAGDPKLLKRKPSDDDKEAEEEEAAPVFPDFTVQLTDSLGNRASLVLSEVKRIAPRLKIQFSKLQRNNRRFGDPWEESIETFHLPLAAFSGMAEGFDLGAIREIRFVFDQVPYGVVILDEIGFGKPSMQ